MTETTISIQEGDVLPTEIILIILSFCDDSTLCVLYDSVLWIDYHKDIRKIRYSDNRLYCPRLGPLCNGGCGQVYCNECKRVCSSCKDNFCDSCSVKCDNCTEYQCKECSQEACIICFINLCDTCGKSCNGCEYILCDDCGNKCSKCNMNYCDDCTQKCSYQGCDNIICNGCVYILCDECDNKCSNHCQSCKSVLL